MKCAVCPDSGVAGLYALRTAQRVIGSIDQHAELSGIEKSHHRMPRAFVKGRPGKQARYRLIQHVVGGHPQTAALCRLPPQLRNSGKCGITVICQHQPSHVSIKSGSDRRRALHQSARSILGHGRFQRPSIADRSLACFFLGRDTGFSRRIRMIWAMLRRDRKASCRSCSCNLVRQKDRRALHICITAYIFTTRSAPRPVVRPLFVPLRRRLEVARFEQVLLHHFVVQRDCPGPAFRER